MCNSRRFASPACSWWTPELQEVGQTSALKRPTKLKEVTRTSAAAPSRRRHVHKTLGRNEFTANEGVPCVGLFGQNSARTGFFQAASPNGFMSIPQSAKNSIQASSRIESELMIPKIELCKRNSPARARLTIPRKYAAGCVTRFSDRCVP